MHHVRYSKIKIALLIAFLLLVIAVLINNIAKIIFPLKYTDLIVKYSNENKIDPYLVFAIIKAESGFDPNARSHKNAIGLMQITEKTGKWGAESLNIKDFKTSDLYDPEINIKIGCWYINTLLKEFNNNEDLAIAAYNGGSGNVNSWLKDSKYSSSGADLDKIPFKETERYLKRVKNYRAIYKKIYE
ncbi:MAG TPA: lytic transglycosylase domain-containing protein [Clostridiaceae bacterium]|nr:lytic transglycosylase domain-containing protein [Clostridiaceae bacterium]